MPSKAFEPDQHSNERKIEEEGPAVPSVQQRQPARRLKQDHHSAGAVVGVNKGDSHSSHLYRAVQRDHVQAGCRHLQTLVHQPGCDGRAVNGACMQPQSAVNESILGHFWKVVCDLKGNKGFELARTLSQQQQTCKGQVCLSDALAGLLNFASKQACSAAAADCTALHHLKSVHAMCFLHRYSSKPFIKAPIDSTRLSGYSCSTNLSTDAAEKQHS